ncbi:sulfite exporter TauE/SafE family protein [Jiella sp. MQZ9-1]|uniref:Probable membrane transporter protein n=1 Tax=Jiella flava TaxID=2816857 RepID=A0A939FY21_9HYPH|nr:sulfite exporter TauE/SafE family protein [Jiella flava]MBO0662098.1 sulfite exporter TauE/SafE family protein [Jiella flava]MCD2470574.1 sulfite exporter TauE/SafE family protein [Jiella flava]
MIFIDGTSLFFFIAVLLLAAAVAGFLAGLFGIGGGAIFVPVLYQVFLAVGVSDHVAMHLAIGSSIAIIVPTSLRSLHSHLQRGAVDTRLLRQWLLAIPLGAVAGAFVASIANAAELKGIFALLALLFGLKMLLGRFSVQIADDLPGPVGRSFAGFAIGFFSALMGIGGGVLNNTFMTLYGRSIHQAVATSAGVGALIAVPGVLGYVVGGWGEAALPALSAGYVNLFAVAVVAPASILGVPAGSRLAHRLSRRQLELGFGIFLLIVAARFALSLT